MPKKQKPHKGLLKRVKVTATGKIVRRKANKGHLMATKTSKRRRHLSLQGQVSKAEHKKIRRLLALS